MSTPRPMLTLLQGGTETPYEVLNELLIGRHPDCQVQLESNMVSRRHARVFRDETQVLVEDLGSGNGTFVNGKRIEAATRLAAGDRVKVGPILLRYDDGTPPTKPRKTLGTLRFDVASGDHDQTTITGSAPSDSGFGLLDVRPEVKLKGIIAISRRLAGTTDLTALLPTLLDSLFEMFPAADRGAILLRAPDGDKLIPGAQKTRQPDSDETVRLSRTVLNKVIQEKTGVLSADASTDQQFEMSESISSLSIRSMMAVPLVGLDDVVDGIIHLDTQNPLAQFKPEDLDLLMAVAGQAALSYESTRLLVSHLEKVKQDSEMEIASDVQRALLPDKFPQVPGYEFYAAYEAAQAVGGDYYDAFELADGRVCVSFGDVAGKGVPGALIMSRIASCVQNVMRFATDLAEAFDAINDHMCAKMVEGRFVTYVLAVIDPQTHEVQLCNGGHASPVIRRADGSVEEFDTEMIGIPIGVMADYPYEVVRRTLGPGEAVVITTDGVDEAMAPDGTLYTRERAVEFVRTAPPHAEDLTLALLADVRRHAAGREQNDDITIMAFGRVEE